MKVKVLKAVAAVLLLGGATANAQSLDGLSCSGELSVGYTDGALSFVCSGNLEISGSWDMPVPLNPPSAVQTFDRYERFSRNDTNAQLSSGVNFGFSDVVTGAVAGSSASVQGRVTDGSLTIHSARRPASSGQLVLSNSSGIVLNLDNIPASILTASSVGQLRPGGVLVVSGGGGLNLSSGNNPPSMLTVSSVPEPQTYALWLAGLAAVARIAAARRRNRC